MDLALLRELQEGEALARRLLNDIQEDRENMGRCVNGELLSAYREAADAAERELQALRAELVDLQARQMLEL